MNRKKLIKRVALGEQIAERWRIRRWFDQAFVGMMRGFYTQPQEFVFLGSDGIYQLDMEYPGGRLISENITTKDEQT